MADTYVSVAGNLTVTPNSDSPHRARAWRPAEWP